MRSAIEISEKSLGPDHPSVAIRLNNLGQLLQDTNRLADAEPLMRRALAIAEQSLGPDHPSVGTCLHNLAQLLQATNRLTEAEPLYRRALAIAEQSLGPNHPSTKTANPTTSCCSKKLKRECHSGVQRAFAHVIVSFIHCATPSSFACGRTAAVRCATTAASGAFRRTTPSGVTGKSARFQVTDATQGKRAAWMLPSAIRAHHKKESIALTQGQRAVIPILRAPRRESEVVGEMLAKNNGELERLYPAKY